MGSDGYQLSRSGVLPGCWMGRCKASSEDVSMAVDTLSVPSLFSELWDRCHGVHSVFPLI